MSCSLSLFLLPPTGRGRELTTAFVELLLISTQCVEREVGVWKERWGCGERDEGVDSEMGVWRARWGCGE